MSDSTKANSRMRYGGLCSSIASGKSAIGLYENQRYRASGLNLVVAAIILWNTTYLQRAVDHLRSLGIKPTPEDLRHLSPLGWEHINLTGDYHWEADQAIGPHQFRPLRTRSVDLAMAA
jgi:hypothetical protein